MSTQKQKQQKGKNKKQGLSRYEDSANEEPIPVVPKGQMKDFSTPMRDSYHPPAVENSWDSYWEAKGYYSPSGEGEPYVMMLPPPNVTGQLHLGHALTVSIQDAIMRWKRMNGHKVLWLPGVDHAGIATQIVVEKSLAKEMKVTRHDLGRDKFLEHVWKWKDVNGNKINNQLRRLGASLDWTREAFTMDDQCCDAVIEAFVTMYESGKIYRANRLVNWSCTLNTAISSIEVEYQDFTGEDFVTVPGYDKKVQVGVIHSFAYKLKEDPSKEIVVATTRIETMLGDVAVAVHPNDPRYKDFIGKELIHPFVSDRIVTVITDDILVDMEFGTGAVKITPGHDPNDFACGQRHNLEMISVLDDTGCITSAGGDAFNGMPRFTARVKVIEALKEKGLYRGQADNAMNIGFCSRSKDIVEPVLRPQWWVDCKEMANKSVHAVKNGELKLIPEHHNKIWFNWLENIQDWCISRQLWWGHRIPAYLVCIKGEDRPDTKDDMSWVVGRNKNEAMKHALDRHPNKTEDDITLEQDPDVLDTWFSSGLFPFSTLGWPNKESADLKEFYPGNLLETGHDILFFWVARMVMMSFELNNQLPFDTVYLHSMVRDKIGRKMSKSLGNVIDPIDVITGITLQHLQDKLLIGNLGANEVKRAAANQANEFPHGIAPCGADALRFGLLSYTTQGRDINLDIQLVVSKREFCNKLWNATKFALLSFPENYVPPTSLKQVEEMVKIANNNFRDLYILNRLARAIRLVNENFELFMFGNVCERIQKFWLNDLCSVYLELIKPVIKGDDKPSKDAALAVLYTCLDLGLKMIHPIMPFVSEELYHRLPGYNYETMGDLMVSKFPQTNDYKHLEDDELNQQYDIFNSVVYESRSMRASLNLTRTKVNMFVHVKEMHLFDSVMTLTDDFNTLALVEKTLVLKNDEKKPEGCVSKVVRNGIETHFEVKGLNELSQEVVKREKQLTSLLKQLDSLNKTINSPNFQKIKPEIQQKNIQQLDETEKAVVTLTESINQLKSFMTSEQMQAYFQAKIDTFENEIKKLEASNAKITKSCPDLTKNKKSAKLKASNDAAIDSIKEEIEQVNKDSQELSNSKDEE